MPVVIALEWADTIVLDGLCHLFEHLIELEGIVCIKVGLHVDGDIVEVQNRSLIWSENFFHFLTAELDQLEIHLLDELSVLSRLKLILAFHY